ncbi:hypothetical protein ASPVEDRAFT_300823 [Aspergillus versicolor CBS 583.65]|uniref:Uncharacterized protein n=1 Tax=Aspergillus versicolor CBS 583.65 TaxID=1036611 RepID=A0A1L9P7U3_ASPVE|nr:uncharacterized protein ASPVEDRAFT_300823 [Aspergillus versicolor CBS 583.65]OJI97581.1 hypothetical protein ASPVEDRAFT_300823 [Aspergillus versicolor CBS 583.65]
MNLPKMPMSNAIDVRAQVLLSVSEYNVSVCALKGLVRPGSGHRNKSSQISLSQMARRPQQRPDSRRKQARSQFFQDFLRNVAYTERITGNSKPYLLEKAQAVKRCLHYATLERQRDKEVGCMKMSDLSKVQQNGRRSCGKDSIAVLLLSA